MTDIVIRVENLGKRYQLGASKSGSFRESMSSLFRRNSAGHPASNPTPYPRRPNPQNPSHSESAPIPNPQSLTPKDFWALQDITFEIKRGEAVGIIGRNGAGKSTLLKILSRITEPTKGRFEIFGRVSSLLEVGTGFHPELTGRENVYLNGTILGMKRREVKAKFDEIVAFSGVEKFIDTPVKHYSSGMQVRLAFAVAAHLEPEILIIDEVLAVGDAEFQRKCLGKMEDVTGEGRTVLFVSHNMGAIRHLCSRGICLENGSVFFNGTQNEAIEKYLQGAILSNDLINDARRKGSGEVTVESIDLISEKGDNLNTVRTGQNLTIKFNYQIKLGTVLDRVIITLHIKDHQNQNIFTVHNRMTNEPFNIISNDGSFCCCIKKLPLPPSSYKIGYTIIRDGEYIDGIDYAAKLDVVSGDYYNSSEIPSINQAIALLEANWILENAD